MTYNMKSGKVNLSDDTVKYITLSIATNELANIGAKELLISLVFP